MAQYLPPIRDMQFVEIYHPLDGRIYGGIQELGDNPRYKWISCPRQTWSATGYIRPFLLGLAGLRGAPDRLSFAPHLPAGLSHLALEGFRWQGRRLDVTIDGTGTHIAEFRVNGTPRPAPIIEASESGDVAVTIRLASP